jgi:threonine dehydrogenase-like Zn-dependent dehydrogenase
MPPAEQGRPMGHEFLGTVEDLGSEVSGLKAGDLVVASFLWQDNTCDFCRKGLQTSCRHGGRAYMDELLPDILDGTIEPGRVFDRTVDLEEVPDGYRAMASRESLKVLIRP